MAFSLVSCSLGSVVLCAAMFECGIFVVLGVVVAIFSIIGDVLRGAGVCFIRHFFLSFGGRLACAWLTDSRGVATPGRRSRRGIYFAGTCFSETERRALGVHHCFN